MRGGEGAGEDDGVKQEDLLGGKKVQVVGERARGPGLAVRNRTIAVFPLAYFPLPSVGKS